LVRLAVVEFRPKLSNWREWSLEEDGIRVAPVRVWEEDDGHVLMLVAASQVLEYRPKVTAENEVVVPDKQRAAAEAAIEVAANLIAASQGCRRDISTPWPPVVFVATGGDGRFWLESCGGIKHDRLKRTMTHAERLDFDDSVLNKLEDRPDGVALLVEALAHDHAMGRYHEFIRLFERAFSRPAKLLTGPVSAFLDPRFGYTQEELRVWFEEYRDPATHADARAGFLLEADVRPVIDRIEQAALDVLFNKERWRDDSTARRTVWMPQAGTDGPEAQVFVTKGSPPPPLKGQILDEYGCFPMNLQAVIEPRPEDWWPREHPRSSKTEPARVRVLDPRE
jgi:hypothetical protein